MLMPTSLPLPLPFRVSVAVLHGDPVIEAGLRALLRPLPEVALLAPGTAAGAEVVVTDLRGALAGHALARLEARAEGGPATRAAPRFLVFAPVCREREVRCALQSGVQGYLQQGCTAEEIAAAVRALAGGARHLCPAALECLADSLGRQPLTGREAEVLQLLAQGLANKDIARQLGVALGTVKVHVRAVMDKLQAASRTHAVVIAAQRGLLGEAEAAACSGCGETAAARAVRPVAPRHATPVG
ncbi:helix-turn-helix transcriptional regulator [Azohydromonas aeria]|uniref:helix-turn-helix transcriptional regulator n=1 Tax=Azohydromonas aeria TaxID=2590212 RepID=UPI001E50C7BA|nr:response regulator transcription factor [Azohydromonas aeria]